MACYTHTQEHFYCSLHKSLSLCLSNCLSKTGFRFRNLHSTLQVRRILLRGIGRSRRHQKGASGLQSLSVREDYL